MKKIDQVKLFGVGVVIISVFIVAMLGTPIVESQQTCSSGTYTLNGNLKVNGDIQANNFQSSTTAAQQQAQPASFGSCVIVDGNYGNAALVSCPAGKILTGALCVPYYIPQGAFGGCGNVNYYVGSVVQPLGQIQGTNGFACSCRYRGPGPNFDYYDVIPHISLFCC